MPLSFQAGLFLTVLVLAGVRFRKSLAAVRYCSASSAVGEFNWQRWFHLAVLWGVVVFCLPFLAGLAAPDSARRASLAVDRATGAQEELLVRGRPSRWRGVGDRDAAARLDTIRVESALARRRTLGALAGAGLAAMTLAVAVSVAARRRRPLALSMAAAGGLAVSAAAFALSGRAASRLSGALDAARAIADYASASVVPAAETSGLAGPVVAWGRPTEAPQGRPGYLYLRDDGGERVSPCAGFSLGPLAVAPMDAGSLVVVRPHVRLAEGGRETFIRTDEDVLVMGFLVGGKLTAADPYPVVIAPAQAHPAGTSAIFEELADGLAGRKDLRSRELAALHVVAGSFAAYFATLILASATEFVLLRRRRSEPDAAPGVPVPQGR